MMGTLSEDVFVRLLPQNQSEDIDMLDAPLATPISNEAAAHQSVEAGLIDLDLHTLTEPPASEQPAPLHNGTNVPQPKFVVAVDFGTTFSTVAFVRVDPGTHTRLIGPESIRCIDHYPDVPIGVSASTFAYNTTVPTELLYSLKKKKMDSAPNSAPILLADDSDDSLERAWASANEESEDEEPQPSPTSKAKPRPSPVWGHAVQNKIVLADHVPTQSKHLTRFKLILDESENTQLLREKIMVDAKALKGAKIIEGPVDIIADYLTPLFRHTKSQLVQSHGLQEDSLMEFVLCVPTLWSEKACRVMQVAMARALEASTLGKLEQGSIKDLFLVAEPEAAAAFALADTQSSKEIHKNETILILDCGGGTVDAITYTVTQTNPLRLREVVPAGGKTCGSSFLNEAFEKRLHERLAGVQPLGSKTSWDSDIREKVAEWENGIKRKIDVTKKMQYIDPVRFRGLQPDKARRFETDRIELEYKEVREIFKSCLQGVEALMQEQLQAAKEKELSVSRVILIGGFGQSPSLKSHLELVLRKERNFFELPIPLRRPDFVESAVARGAVLRALRKEDGPVRISRTSYGVLRSDLYDKTNPKHQGLRGTRDRADGQLYIRDTIDWKIQKDEFIPSTLTTPVRSRHVLKAPRTRLLCEEILYVSGRRHESGYRKTHEKNRGSEEAGRIVVDLTFLITEEKIQPVEYFYRGKMYTFYEVEFDLFLIVEGRNLRFEARSPRDPDRVEASTQFSIAAGFVPGTV